MRGQSLPGWKYKKKMNPKYWYKKKIASLDWEEISFYYEKKKRRMPRHAKRAFRKRRANYIKNAIIAKGLYIDNNRDFYTSQPFIYQYVRRCVIRRNRGLPLKNSPELRKMTRDEYVSFMFSAFYGNRSLRPKCFSSKAETVGRVRNSKYFKIEKNDVGEITGGKKVIPEDLNETYWNRRAKYARVVLVTPSLTESKRLLVEKIQKEAHDEIRARESTTASALWRKPDVKRRGRAKR